MTGKFSRRQPRSS